MDCDRLICRGESTSAEWLKECADLEHGYDELPSKDNGGTAALTGWPYDGVDLINSPPHYNHGKMECIDAIEAALTPEEYRGYLKGTVFKYLWRERLKGGDESLKKAEWFLRRMTK
jgi:Protein of unknwon function (DUF3310)